MSSITSIRKQLIDRFLILDQYNSNGKYMRTGGGVYQIGALFEKKKNHAKAGPGFEVLREFFGDLSNDALLAKMQEMLDEPDATEVDMEGDSSLVEEAAEVPLPDGEPTPAPTAHVQQTPDVPLPEVPLPTAEPTAAPTAPVQQTPAFVPTFVYTNPEFAHVPPPAQRRAGVRSKRARRSDTGTDSDSERAPAPAAAHGPNGRQGLPQARPHPMPAGLAEDAGDGAGESSVATVDPATLAELTRGLDTMINLYQPANAEQLYHAVKHAVCYGLGICADSYQLGVFSKKNSPDNFVKRSCEIAFKDVDVPQVQQERLKARSIGPRVTDAAAAARGLSHLEKMPSRFAKGEGYVPSPELIGYVKLAREACEARKAGAQAPQGPTRG